MLQRAASSAYSWWWASHIRTTQSKWLDTNLQEMEARVKAMIKLIGADADSFAKKAELYFKSRPELINHVEEMYRSYQALADRYDRISGELHKANHTIATACPEQVQFTMQDGDGDGFPKALTGIDLSNFQPPPLDGPPMNLQGVGREISPFPENLRPHKRISSQMSKEKAQGEIDSLQKQILGLQTEKEFVKSSYETGLAKYSDIERQIREMQDEVCNLQDIFSTSATIKDNEVQALMTVQAIMSCKDTLVSLQDQQKKSFEEARKEFQRIKEARQKLKIFKSEYGQPHDTELSVTMESADDDGSFLNEYKLDLQAICQKVEERFELCSKASVAELAQKVDGLVDKVISIELATSLQNAQINRMSSEADELHKHLQALEEDKAASIGGSKKLTNRPKQVEEVLKTVHQIEKSIQNERVNIHKQLTEACFDLTDFVEKLHAPKFQNGEVVADSSQESKGTASEEDNAKGTAPKPRTLTELLLDDSGLTSKGNIHEQLTEAYGGHTDLVERLYVSEPQKGEVIVNSSQESKGIAFEEDDAKGTAPKPGTQTELLRDDSRLPIKGNVCKQLTEACNDHSDFVERLCAPELEDSEVVSQESGTASEEYDEKGQAELLQDDSGLTSRGNIDKQSIEACDNRTGSMEELCASEPQNTEVVVDTSQESKGIASEEDDAKGTAPMAGTLTEILQDVSGLTSKSVNKESSDSFEDCKDTQDEESEGPLVWQQLVLNGLEGKDTILLKDYISILRNYKDTKQRLSEIEKKNQEDCLQAMSEVRELRSANATKDEEIRFLWRMLCSLKAKLHASLPQNIEKPEESSKTSTTHISEDKVIAEVEEYIKQCQVQGPHVSSVVEKKFRAEIDRLLEENLDFWLRFTTSYHQTRSFKALFDKLKAEMDKLTDAQAQEASETVSASHQATKLGSAALEKKVQELNTDLQVWLEKNVLLKGELESRFSSLCSMQEEISKITTLNQTDEVCFTPFQAAKFQGEVLNMKQENNKVAKELEAELDLVRGLQVEAGRVLLKLRESFELSVTRSNRVQQNIRNLSTKAVVPLRTFLFGKKRKKSSIFSCMNPSVHKQHRDMAGHPR